MTAPLRALLAFQLFSLVACAGLQKAFETPYDRQERLRAEAAARATTQQQLMLPELGLSAELSGDYQATRSNESEYGSPAVTLEAMASGLRLTVADASQDRYGLSERVRQLNSEFRMGIDVLRKEEKADGSLEIEFVYRPMQRYEVLAPRRGYFTRRNIGSKRVNCVGFELSPDSLSQAIRTCSVLASAQ